MKVPAPRRAVRRTFRPSDGEGTLDEGMLLWFPGPRSFTGEDVAEFHVHGGPAVVSAILDALSECAGTRVAEPGEFTKRAFLNGKMDLTAAEGVADLIEAETEAQRRQAQRQAAGALGAVYEAWRGRLMTRLAHVEAAIDFPDEDLPETLLDNVRPDILGLKEEIIQHIDDSAIGERLRTGIEVAIVGPPNAGKSSLLNALAGRDAAIVSEVAGTTRDVVEVRMDLAGLPVTLSDTAGLRDASEDIEAEGIRRARERFAGADIRVIVFDVEDPLVGGWESFKTSDSMTVLNKMDRVDDAPQMPVGDLGQFEMSLRTGAGLGAFVEALSSVVQARFDGGSAPVITRARHREAVAECLAALERSLAAPLPELAAEDLRLAMRALGRITGQVDVEDLLDIVFRDFCIGK
tara:strand:- start:1635 stop:2852 length:1218 start_codon:yes stop_codon:yes gene_type:complete